MPVTKTPQNEDLSTLVDRLPRTKTQAVARTLGLFSRLPLAWQLGFAALGMGVAVFCGLELRKILSSNQDNLARTLAATMVSTAYPHRGVTAFLVAELDKNVPSLGIIPNLRTKVDAIKSDIEGASSKAFDPNKVFEDLKLEVTDKPNLRPEDKDLTWTKIITSRKMESDMAFLMVPVICLRQSDVGDNTIKDEKQLKTVFHNNQEILFDLYVASKIDKAIKRFK